MTTTSLFAPALRALSDASNAVQDALYALEREDGVRHYTKRCLMDRLEAVDHAIDAAMEQGLRGEALERSVRGDD